MAAKRDLVSRRKTAEELEALGNFVILMPDMENLVTRRIATENLRPWRSVAVNLASWRPAVAKPCEEAVTSDGAEPCVLQTGYGESGVKYCYSTYCFSESYIWETGMSVVFVEAVAGNRAEPCDLGGDSSDHCAEPCGEVMAS